MDQKSTATLLKEIRTAAGVSVREMASRVGMAPSSYQHYEDPKRFKSIYLPLDIAIRFSQALEAEGFSEEVLTLTGSVTGEQARKNVREIAEATHALGDDTRLLDELTEVRRVEAKEPKPTDATLIPVYDVAASAGSGSVVSQEEQVHSLAFPPAYLRKLTTSSPGNLSIISVKGDSMEPTLLDDDIVLLDNSKTHVGYDGLFVLRFNDTLHIKRVGLSPKKNHVQIISDNRDIYPAFDMELPDIEVVGKVLWYGRKV